MVKCPKCGNEAHDNPYCAKCGTKIEKELICPECNQKLDESSAFCPNCGTKLEDSGEEENKDNENEASQEPMKKIPKTTKKKAKTKLHKKMNLIKKIPKTTKKKAKTKLHKKMNLIKKILKMKRKSLRKKLKKLLQIQMMVKKSIVHFAILKLMMKPISVRNAENQ